MNTAEKDKEILGVLQRDRHAGFRMLFDTYYNMLCLYSLEMTDDFHASEDIVQTFFVRFWEERLEKKVRTNLSGYMFASVRNNSLMYLRQHDGLDFLKIETEESIGNSYMHLLAEDGDDESLVRREQQLHASLQNLSESEREALTLTVCDDMTYSQASDDMGISINTLKTHLKRAMKKLRRINTD